MTTVPVRTSRAGLALAVLMSVYVTIQIALPLRHHFYPGRAVWTEEGRLFAWQMMLRDKTGNATFIVTEESSGGRWEENPSDYMTAWQLRNMVGNPDMLLEFAHFLAETYRQRGHPSVEVRAQTLVSLNGRPPQPIVDESVDLARESRGLARYPWITPLRAQ